MRNEQFRVGDVPQRKREGDNFASAKGANVNAKKAAHSFDSQAFLAKVGNGRTLAKYRAKEPVFSQGDTADAVFYVQKGKIKITVLSKTGKEAVVAHALAAREFRQGGQAGIRNSTDKPGNACRDGRDDAIARQYMNNFRRLGFIEYDGDLKVHISLLT